MIVLICLVGVIGAGLPVANGIIMERMVKNAVEKQSQRKRHPGLYYRIKIVDYDRQLYSSCVTWQIEARNRFPGKDMPRLILVDRATHGLFSITSRTSLEKNPWYTDWVNTRLNGKDPLAIRTRVSVTGTIASNIHLDGFSFQDQGKNFQVGAMDADISSDKGGATLKADGNWQGASDGPEFKLGPASFLLDLHRLTSLVWEGQSTFILERLKMDKSSEASLDLQNVSWACDTTALENKKQMNLRLDLHADGVTLNRRPLSAWSAGLKLKQVDIQGVERILALYSDMLARAGQRLDRQGGSLSDFQPVLKDEMTRNRSRAISALNGLLKKGAGLEISQLDIELPQGKVTGSLDVNLEKDINTSLIYLFVLRPEKIFSSFSLDVALKVPAELVTGNTWLTEPLIPGMATGLFIAGQDRFSLDMQLRQERLFLNGSQVVLDR